MKIKRLIRVLESVLQDYGNVDAVILDNDSEALIDVTRIGLADDGRLAIYGDWSAPAPYGRIAKEVWSQEAE